MRAADGACGGTGKDDAEGCFHGVLRRDQVCRAVGEIELPRETDLAQPVIKTARIGVVDDLHEHVDQGGGGARVLLGQR